MTASDKQIAANRINAQKAGVKTDDGKKRVRFNAVKHGLTSKSLLTWWQDLGESADLYAEILAGLHESFGPRNFFEEMQVDQMAKALIKLRRYDFLEAQCFQDDFDFGLSKTRPQLVGSEFERLLKYKQALEGQYYRALLSLQSGRETRQLDLFRDEGDHDGRE